MEFDGNEQNWTGPHVRGVGRTGLSWTVLQKAELHGTAPHWTGLS